MRLKVIIIMIVIVVFGFCSVIAQLGYLQFVKGGDYQKQAMEQQLRDISISPKRGTIYDRNMKKLAQSADVWNIIICPASVPADKRNLVADGLAGILGDVDRDVIYEKTGKGNQYEIVKRKVEDDIKEKVSAFIVENKLGCITLEIDNKRYYPFGNFAASILGFTGMDNEGLDGIESYYERFLKGEPGRMVAAKNAQGADMSVTYEKMYDAKNGNDLVLSIDEVTQHFLEKNLEKAVVENKLTNRACGIVMNVNTGEILAMSTKNDYDPNQPRTIADTLLSAQIDALSGKEKTDAIVKEQALQWRNKAVSDTYEPGSVFKAFTLAMAVEEGLADKGETYGCSGVVERGGEKIHCHVTSGHGTQTLLEATKNSCNPAFIAIGEKVGANNFFKYLSAFGFTEKTGIDLPGESGSIFYTADRMNVVELATCSFGQSNTFTPIQMITAMSAIANGGNLMQPHVVTKILDDKGNIVKNIEPTIKRQVISKETSAKVCDILEKVVSGGTGKNSYIMGYQIAGKTGTSQKIDLKIKEGRDEHIASFCAFGPAEKPEIAVLIMLDEPHGKSYYGGTIAAPVARDIMADLLPYLGVEPHYTAEELAKMDVNSPAVVNKELAAAKTALDNVYLKYLVVGSGANVLRQVPEAGKPVPRNGTVVLYTDDAGKKTRVPDFNGLSLAQVNSAAVNANLNVRLVGPSGTGSSSDTAYKQSYEPATEVDSGTVVVVEFIHMDSVE